MGGLILAEKEVRRLEELCNNSSPISISHEQFLEFLDNYALESHPLIKKMLERAIIVHGSQKRDDGGDMLSKHVYVVAKELLESLIEKNKLNPDLICRDNEIKNSLATQTAGAIGHEFGEEDKYYIEHPLAIEKEFGPAVSDIISVLTRPDYRIFPGKNKLFKKIKAEIVYRNGLLKASESKKDIKLLDRIPNTKESVSLFCGLYKGTIDPSYCTEKVIRKNAKYILESPFYIYLARYNPELQKQLINATGDLNFIYTIYNFHRKGKLYLTKDAPKKISLKPSYGTI